MLSLLPDDLFGVRRRSRGIDDKASEEAPEIEPSVETVGAKHRNEAAPKSPPLPVLTHQTNEQKHLTNYLTMLVCDTSSVQRFANGDGAVDAIAAIRKTDATQTTPQNALLSLANSNIIYVWTCFCRRLLVHDFRGNLRRQSAYKRLHSFCNRKMFWITGSVFLGSSK